MLYGVLPVFGLWELQRGGIGLLSRVLRTKREKMLKYRGLYAKLISHDELISTLLAGELFTGWKNKMKSMRERRFPAEVELCTDSCDAKVKSFVVCGCFETTFF